MLLVVKMPDKDVVRAQLFYTLLGAVLLTSASNAEGEDKWVWSGGSRSISGGRATPYFPGDSDRPLYRPPAPVFETTDFTNPPPFLQPSRPVSRPPYNNRPIIVPRPDGPGPQVSRPGNSGILTNPDSPRPGGPGILTGPVPSWDQRPGDKFAYKDYEHCKCAYSFNCASPGIKFGHCDTEKQYCCYSPKPSSNLGPSPANRGPGFIEPPVKPTYDRPILVGPGGPTGIISDGGRPFEPPGGLYRPLRGDDLDEDFRMNRRPYQGYGTINDERFPRPQYDPYARSANVEMKKNGKKL